MDLALNYLQRLICPKTKPTNQPNNSFLYKNGFGIKLPTEVDMP